MNDTEILLRFLKDLEADPDSTATKGDLMHAIHLIVGSLQDAINAAIEEDEKHGE